MVIRPMLVADLGAVHALQCAVHSGHYHEPLSALASRLTLGPQFCFVAEQEDRVVGYLFAHPWAGNPPALHEVLTPCLTGEIDHLFMHDLAVSPMVRGASAGHRLIDAVVQKARATGWSDVRLVAVGDAREYWQRNGFGVVAGVVLHVSYGAAVLMQRRLVDETVTT